MMVVPVKVMSQMLPVKYCVKEEEATRVIDNDLGCTPADKVECLDFRTYQAWLSMEDRIGFGVGKCSHKDFHSNTDSKECFEIED